MKFVNSPLSVVGFMILLASILLLTAMASRNYWPTIAYFYTGGFGILMMICDYFFIRKLRVFKLLRYIFYFSIQAGLILH